MAKQKILVIDDEEDIINILSFLLQHEGYEVQSAPNGKVALEYLSAQHFDGVVCDLIMPEMDGISLIKKVRANKNLVPFLFLSGHAGRPEEHDMINYGAYALIVKPHVDKIPEVLKKLLKENEEVKSIEHKTETTDEFLGLLFDSKKEVA